MCFCETAPELLSVIPDDSGYNQEMGLEGYMKVMANFRVAPWSNVFSQGKKLLLDIFQGDQAFLEDFSLVPLDSSRLDFLPYPRYLMKKSNE